MCNRFRSIKEWSDIPRRFHSGPRLNFEFNPNVAPTELVPIWSRGKASFSRASALTGWVRAISPARHC
jgi:putative SOS response-associated peptidase YedK